MADQKVTRSIVEDTAAKAHRYEANREQGVPCATGAGRALRQIIDALPDPMVILDHEGMIVEVNAAWRRFDDLYARTNRASATMSYLDICEHDHRIGSYQIKLTAQGLRNVADGLQHSFDTEHCCINGSHSRWFNVHITLITFEGCRWVLVTHHETTALKELHLHMQQNRKRLQYLEQEEVLQSLRNDIIAALAHDIRIPLTLIYLAGSTLQQYSANMREADKQECITTISSQAAELRNMLEEFLYVNRRDRLELPFRPRPLDMRQFCQEVVERSQALTRLHNIQLMAEIEMELMADPYLLRHALMNLMANAIKYSPRGGSIRLVMNQTNGYLNLHISDEGIGIPSQDLAHLFEPHYRASNTGQIQGSGLGLFMVKFVVEMHKGLLHVSSTVGKGTTFIVQLPVVAG